MKDPVIRKAEDFDAEAIADIYNPYILKTVITFEEEAIDAAEIRRRLKEVEDDGNPWLVAEEDGAVIGYAYAAKWKSRCAYRDAVEAAVYLKEDRVRRGTGTALYEKLLDALRARGRHFVLGGIALPNDASVRLHEKLGFKKAAHFHEIGYKFGERVDVGYWELLLK